MNMTGLCALIVPEPQEQLLCDEEAAQMLF